jgi:hypothetical protein
VSTLDATRLVTPDERTFRAHLDRASFQAGVDRGRWRVLSIDWPHATVTVSAAPRPDSPDEFYLRLELTGYPQQAPMVTPWDPITGDILAADKRPRGEIVSFVFRSDWENGRALYTPYDRIGLGHGNWAAEHPGHAWNGSRDITFVLGHVHRLLNSDDYLGAST